METERQSPLPALSLEAETDLLVSDSLFPLCHKWKDSFSLAAKWTGQNIHIRTLEDRIEAAAWEADILLDNICATNATDVAGIIAKLSVAIECNRLSPDNEDQPWRCVVSALRDLRRISADDTDYLSGKRAA